MLCRKAVVTLSGAKVCVRMCVLRDWRERVLMWVPEEHDVTSYPRERLLNKKIKFALIFP